jgi:RHS repeat-associated protein
MSGRLIRSTAGVGLIASEMVQSANYGYDSFGNLTHRTEELTGFSETFGYDGLNRLVTQSVSSSTGTELHTYGYDFFGNLTTKPNVGNYQYGSYTSSDSCSDTGNYRDLGPHAVYEVGGRVYCYDEYGNQTSSSDRRISYSVIGKPVQISGEMSNASFMYGPDESRFYQRKQIGSEVMETFYVAGGLYEEEISDGLSTLKSYVDDFLIDKRGANHSQSYVLRDHLGSIDVIVNAEEGGQATVVETMSFSPFGERRLDGRVTSTLNPITDDRGFTDHEHLDEFDLTHMNGRVYDPVIGRFLAADPYVQDFKSSQSWNRYSYAWNNPLSSTDPSGYICVGLCDIDIPFTDIPMGFDLDWLSSDSSLQPVNSFLNGLVGNDFTPGAYTGSSDLDLIRYTHDEFKAEKYYNSGSHLGDIVLDQLDFSSVFDSLIEDGVLSAAGLLVKKKVPYINILDHVSDYKFAKGAGQLGREGEATASAITGVGKNTQKFTVNGRKRIPDQVNTSNISTRNPLHVTEVKNVKFQSFTRQLRDNVDLVGPGGRVDVFVRPNTKLSGPLRRANADPTNPINIRPEL